MFKSESIYTAYVMCFSRFSSRWADGGRISTHVGRIAQARISSFTVVADDEGKRAVQEVQFCVAYTLHR